MRLPACAAIARPLLAGILLVGSGALASAEAVTVDVFAFGNSLNGSGVDLDTGVDLSIDDRLVVTATGCWSAGAAPRDSDADGLDGSSPCPPTGDFGFFSFDGESFRFGALVGRLDSQDWFLIGTSFDQVLTQAGRLFLVYWDSNNHDNSGSVKATITVNPDATVPLPGSLLLLGVGLLGSAVLVRGRAR